MFKINKEPQLRTLQNELSKLGSTLSAGAAEGEATDIFDPLQKLEEVCDELQQAASGSWLGYHAYVYYAGLSPAPPGANFSQEWGLKDLSFTSLGSVGDWRQFDPRVVKQHAYTSAGVADLERPEAKAAKARRTLEAAKSELASIFEVLPKGAKDDYLSELFKEVANLKAPTSGEIIQVWQPRGQIMTRDMVAMGQGSKAPPHLEILSQVLSIRAAFKSCEAAAELCQKMSSHLRRKGDMTNEATSLRIFIGHGRSLDWRELKDFLQEKLQLPWNEFNRVSAAGVPTTIRLGELLDDSKLAFLVLTAEDETADGEVQARMNVIHEVGLFQGRLGFSKAIVLLEQGCAEFSNIAGLGQIRFPKGKISSAFEEIREVLEREGIIS